MKTLRLAVLATLICSTAYAEKIEPNKAITDLSEHFEELYPDSSIKFDTNKSAIKDNEKAKLAIHAKHLRSDPSRLAVIAGHADERGSDIYNIKLANKRAETAKQFLLKHGVHESQLLTIVYGERKPLKPSPLEGNRRVTISYERPNIHNRQQ